VRTARAAVWLAAALLAGCDGTPPPAEAPSVPLAPPAVPAPEAPAAPAPPPRLPAPGEDPDFPAKTPPGPRDWLARFKEPGQSPEEYRESCRNRKAAERGTVVLQPLGRIAKRHGDLLEKVRAYAALFFDARAVVAEPLPLSPGDRVEARGQWDANGVLLDLGNRVPGDAVAVLGFCEDELNFVFGVAAPSRRAGVWSVARLAQGGDAGVLLRRVLQVATHECGHLLGMEHCVRWQCLMNGSNSLDESDRTPLHLCPECQEKLRWNTGLDPRRRWDGLAAFYEREGFAEDAALARRQAGR